MALATHSPSSAEVKETVELYLYPPYRPYGLYRVSVPVQGCTLSLPLTPVMIDTRRLQAAARKRTWPSVI